MKILMVNKFLYPNGGSETYMIELGAYLASHGHEVQYFGMERPGRCVGNRADVYTETVDFHNSSLPTRLTYPFRIIRSREAARKIRIVLDDFHPDVVHLNNFNYQLTPSIIPAIVRWREEEAWPCRIVYTAHDFSLVCPNHLMQDPLTNKSCEKCLGGHFLHCVSGRCIHGSTARSLFGAAEAFFWKHNGVYRYLDALICCSDFMKQRLDTNPLLRVKTLTIHNFVERPSQKGLCGGKFVLYFGRYTSEKGFASLLDVCKRLPDIPFVLAGSGPMEAMIPDAPNIRNLGFLSREVLEAQIRDAAFTVCPSECYDNCPLSVMESISLGTPVIGARTGGVPELIRDGENGELFTPGDREELAERIRALWSEPARYRTYASRCLETEFDDAASYAEKLVKVYRPDGDKDETN